MNCRPALGLVLAAIVLAGCKASNTNKATATRQPPTPSGTPSPAPTSPSTPPPRTTPPATSAPRIGVAGQIVIGANGFTPAEITVQTGRPITFRNQDTVPHRVVSTQAGIFDTGDIPPGGSASVTISSSGFTDFHDAAQPAHSGSITTLP